MARCTTTAPSSSRATGRGWCRHPPVAWRARCLVLLAGHQLRRLVDQTADLVKRRPDAPDHEIPQQDPVGLVETARPRPFASIQTAIVIANSDFISWAGTHTVTISTRRSDSAAIGSRDIDAFAGFHGPGSGPTTIRRYFIAHSVNGRRGVAGRCCMDQTIVASRPYP